MNSNDIWKCPNCGTVNSGNICRVCKYALTPTNLAQKKLSNKSLLIALISIGCMLIVAATVFAIYFFLLRDPIKESTTNTVAAETVTPSEVNEEEIYYVNKFTDNGIYVRSEPSKSGSKVLYIKKGDQDTKLKYLDEKEKGSDNWFWYMVETPEGDVGYVREDVVVLWEGDE